MRDALLAELDSQVDLTDEKAVHTALRRAYPTVLEHQDIVLSRSERVRLFQQVVAEILGYGPIEPLLHDHSVTEIMVNGPKAVYVERNGKIYKTDITFENEDHVMRIIERIVGPIGRRVDESSPMVDARLPDGSRVNATIPPLSLIGPVLTIRKFAVIPYTDEDLIRFGTMSREFAEFLKACVKARLNILISGGTGTGKTTLLNVVSGYVPNDERIITIEDAAELQLKQEHVVRLEARPPNIEGKGQVTIRDLVINALRMRPDRIIVGEVRGGEALDMLQAMNTGHDGSLSTLHANGPRDALRRLETMVLMSGMQLPLRAVREQMASAIDLIVHLERLKDGSRRVVQATEVEGMEGDAVVTQDIFAFEMKGIRDGRIIGELKPTGIRPKFAEKMEERDVHLPASIFGFDLDLRERRE
ncbi:MAG: CpaF family protein [Chloroflexi bacterium]|nr:CpaF family protein [Chloroflexota bacterium]